MLSIWVKSYALVCSVILQRKWLTNSNYEPRADFPLKCTESSTQTVEVVYQFLEEQSLCEPSDSEIDTFQIWLTITSKTVKNVGKIIYSILTNYCQNLYII